MPKAVTTPVGRRAPKPKTPKANKKDQFKKTLGFTHKWQKNPNSPWKYLKVKSEETTGDGRTVLTFTDEGSSYRSYYEEDVVQL